MHRQYKHQHTSCPEQEYNEAFPHCLNTEETAAEDSPEPPHGKEKGVGVETITDSSNKDTRFLQL